MLGFGANNYGDVYGGAFEPDNFVIDFTNATQFRIVFTWDYGHWGRGTAARPLGQQGEQRARSSYEVGANFAADQDGVDSGWLAPPRRVLRLSHQDGRVPGQVHRRATTTRSPTATRSG